MGAGHFMDLESLKEHAVWSQKICRNNPSGYKDCKNEVGIQALKK